MILVKLNYAKNLGLKGLGGPVIRACEKKFCYSCGLRFKLCDC